MRFSRKAEIYYVCSKEHNLIGGEQRDISGVNFGQWDEIICTSFFFQSIHRTMCMKLCDDLYLRHLQR